MVSIDQNSGARARGRRLGAACLAVVAVVLAVLGVSQTARAGTPGPERPKETAAAYEGPSISFKMGMAHPNSYNHATGETSASWGPPSGGMGNQWDWVDYHCGDIVPFFIEATNHHAAAEGPPSATFDLGLAFDAATSDADAHGAGFTEITGVELLSSQPAGAGAKLLSSGLTAKPYTDDAKLKAVVRVSDLPAGGTALIRVKVRLTCEVNGHRHGTLTAGATEAKSVPDGQDLHPDTAKQRIVDISNDHGGGYFSVTKTPSVDSVSAPGASVTFTVDIVNHDEDPLPIDAITDDVFDDVTQVSDNVTATTCELPLTVPANDTATCTFTAEVTGDAGTVHTDTVTVLGLADEHSGSAAVKIVAAEEPAGPPENPPSELPSQPPSQLPPQPPSQAPSETLAPAVASLSLTNTPDRQSASIGDVITFTLKVTNDGPQALTNVRVTDPPLNIDSPVGDLPVGGSQTLTGKYTVVAADVTAGQVLNTAKATSNEAPPTDATAIVTVTNFTKVADVRVGGITASALPATGARSTTPLMLWLAAALAATGSAYLVAGRKPQRVYGRR